MSRLPIDPFDRHDVELPMREAFERAQDQRTIVFRRVVEDEVSARLDEGFAVVAGHRGGDGARYGLAVLEADAAARDAIRDLQLVAATDRYDHLHRSGR